MCFFFQAEDGIRYYYASRGLGDVYKRQLRQKPGALTPVIKRLESLGFLRREPSLEDERSIRICLTNEGNALKEQAKAVRDSVASVWTENEDSALFDQLAKLRESLSDDEEVSC